RFATRTSSAGFTAASARTTAFAATAGFSTTGPTTRRATITRFTALGRVALATALPIPGVLAIVVAAAAACSRFVGSFLRLCNRLRTSATRNIRVFAGRPPLAARGHAVIEADQVAQLVELELPQLARVADAQIVERQVRKRDPLKLVDVEA